MRIIFLMLFCSAASFLDASELPAHIALSYTMQSGAISATVEETLDLKTTQGVRHYTLHSEARASGLAALLKNGSIKRASTGILTEQGLRPVRFSDQRGDKVPAVALFDWDKKSLTLQHEGQESKKDLPAQTQDRLSFLYSLVFCPPVGDTLEVHETDGRGLSLFRYTVGKETLATPLGKLDTVVLTKVQDKGDLRGRKIWLATAHHHLPVRLVVTEKDGSQIEQMINKITYPTKP